MFCCWKLLETSHTLCLFPTTKTVSPPSKLCLCLSSLHTEIACILPSICRNCCPHVVSSHTHVGIHFL